MSSTMLFVRCFSDFENAVASCLTTQIIDKEVFPLSAKGSKLSTNQEQSLKLLISFLLLGFVLLKLFGCILKIITA